MEKYDFLDKNRKPTLKERFKRVIALCLTLSALAGFGACKKADPAKEATTKTPNPPSISTITDNSVTEPEEPIFTTIDNGTTGPEHTDPIPAEIPVAEINAFAESLKGGNFTTYAANTTRKQVGDLVELEMQGEFHKIVSVEDGVNYVYDYNATQGKWTKDFLEIPIDGPFTNSYVEMFGDTTWTSYDEQTGVVSGIWTPDAETLAQYQGAVSAENPVDFKFTEDGAELGILGTTARIFDINKTQITLPQTYIDNTIENNDIYTVDEQGNYDFNLVLMKEVLLDWMKGNNQWGKDALAYCSKADTFRTDDILYINASLTDVRIGLLMHRGEEPYFYENYIKDDSFYSKLASQEIKTKEEFQQYLNSILPKRFGYTDTQIKLDTSLSKSDFETITTNIFNHLVNVGTQSSINEEGELHPEYANAKVLFGFARKSSTSIGFDMGNIDGYVFHYLLEINGEIKLTRIWATAQNNFQNAINNVQGKWLISGVEELKQIDEKNKDILPEEKFITSESTFEKGMEL